MSGISAAILQSAPLTVVTKAVIIHDLGSSSENPMLTIKNAYAKTLGFVAPHKCGSGELSFEKAYVVGVTTERSEDGEETTVCVEGRFDYRIYDSFKACYRSIPAESTCINVDLSATEYMDSSALGMLLMLREHVGRAAKILLLNPSPDVKNVLAIANFDKLFSIRS